MADVTLAAPVNGTVELKDRSLTPGDKPRIAPTRFEDWLSRSTPQK